MSTIWDFSSSGASVLKTLRDADPPREQSFVDLSLRTVEDLIYLYESGEYATAIAFEQIGLIAGVAPTDLDDAYSKIEALIQQSGGGGIQSVVAGTNITVDNTDPLNPIVNAGGGGATPALQAVIGAGDEYISPDGLKKVRIIGDAIVFLYRTNILEGFSITSILTNSYLQIYTGGSFDVNIVNAQVKLTNQSTFQTALNAVTNIDNSFLIFTDLTSTKTLKLKLPDDYGLIENLQQQIQYKDGTFAYMDDIPTTATDIGALAIDGSNATGTVSIGGNNFEANRANFLGTITSEGNVNCVDVNASGDIFALGAIQSAGNLVLTTASTTADLPPSTDRNYVTDAQLGVFDKLNIHGSFSSSVTAQTAFVITLPSTPANGFTVGQPAARNILSAVPYYIDTITANSFTVRSTSALTGTVAFDWVVFPN